MESIKNATSFSQNTFGTPDYPYNENMEKFVYAVANVTYVTNELQESNSASKIYTYILELDSNDNIIGGEWYDSSSTNHPDFLWVPTSKPSDDAVTPYGLSYADILELADASSTCTSFAECSPLQNDVDNTGQDIGSIVSPAAEGCCKICNNNPDCRAFSWSNYNGGTCWLKKSKGSIVVAKGDHGYF